MPATPFLTLEQLVLPPPWDPLLAVAIALGLWSLGYALARRWTSAPQLLDVCAWLVVVAAAVAALAHAVAWLGLATLTVSRIVGWGLAATGAIGAGVLAPRLFRSAPARLAAAWRGLSRLERAGAVAVAVALAGFALAALGPPTDPDSLDYHLGAVLEWLRQGSIAPRLDWLSYRLTGIGEALNMIGLAAGTDVLGAVLNSSALVVAIAAVGALARRPGDAVLAALLVVSCPLMTFLVPNQKPQLLPAAALGLAVALLLRAPAAATRDLWLAATCVCFAAACKLSMWLPGAAAAGLLLVHAAWSGRLGAAALALLGVGVLLVGPVLLRNWVQYGDPITPFLERFKGAPDPAVMRFAAGLRAYGVQEISGPWWLRCLAVIAPPRAGNYGTALGVGAFSAVLAVRGARSRQTAGVLVAALLAVAAVLALGQVGGRFLLEPYLWLAMLAVSSTSRLRRPLQWALTAQGGLAAVIAAGLAASLVPGGVSVGGRERVMVRSALGVLEWRWLERAAPGASPVILASRARALATRPFFALDHAGRADRPDLELATFVREQGAATVVAGVPVPPTLRELVQACGGRSVRSEPIPVPFRNPFNTGASYRLEAIELEPGQARCAAWLGARAGAP